MPIGGLNAGSEVEAGALNLLTKAMQDQTPAAATADRRRLPQLPSLLPHPTRALPGGSPGATDGKSAVRVGSV